MSNKINKQPINIVIKAILNDVISANIPSNGGVSSKPTLDVHVAKVIPFVALILGSWPINDIVNGNTTDMPRPINANPNTVNIGELILIITNTPIAAVIAPHLSVVMRPKLLVK